jgi:acyl carrier protein phosphodiesterase
MNFLAHIYLSGNNPKLMVGNFIGDFVKGRNLLEQFEPDIARGIELHRTIDDFTDHHPVVTQSKIRLRAKYRHYAAVIVDIFYDHFLARYWHQYHPEPLKQFTERTYQTITGQWNILPDGVKLMLPHMVKHNWLLHYGEVPGVARVLQGMAQRSRFNSRMDESIVELEAFYEDFKGEFELFFPDLKQHTEQFIRTT